MIRSMLRMQVLSRTAETLADTAYDSWDDYTDHELFLASTSDSLVLDDSVPSGSESVPTVESQNALYATTSWGTTWTWHKGWNHDTARSFACSVSTISDC